MGSAETALALTLTARQASDFELLANGGFAPLTGFMGSADHKSVCEDMRLTSGEIWPIPITLATDLECEVGDVVELSAPNGKALGRLTVEEIYEKDVELEAEKVYRTTDDDHPGVAAIREEGARCIAGPIEADALPDHEEAFMKRYQTAAGVEAVVRRPRLEADRRLPDPQPDPPRARVPDQGGAGDLRRALHPPADRRDQEGRHPRRRADALLRGPDGQLLPPGPRDARRQPRQDALRGPARGGPARDHPPQLRLHALHRRPRPRRRRRLLRHLRRAADLRRHRHRPSSGSRRCSSSTRSGATSARGWARRRPARIPRNRTCSSPGPRCARCSRPARSRPHEFSRDEVAEILIDAYKEDI